MAPFTATRRRGTKTRIGKHVLPFGDLQEQAPERRSPDISDAHFLCWSGPGKRVSISCRRAGREYAAAWFSDWGREAENNAEKEQKQKNAQNHETICGHVRDATFKHS